MSKLIYRRGNLLDLAETGYFDIIVHGANCFNTMGGGIAGEIRNRYPSVAAIDGETKKGDYTKLGNWTAGSPSNDFIIINAYTQFGFSSGEDVFEYSAFTLILNKLLYLFPNKRFGFPYIGMGLARGDKNRIIPMIEQFADNINTTGGSSTLVEFLATRK